MKNSTIKIISTFIIFMLIMGALSTCFAAYEPLTQDNLTDAFDDIDAVTSSALQFDVTDSDITVTYNSNDFDFDYSLSDRTFTKEIPISGELDEVALNKIKPELLATLYGYIAASIVQRKSVSESTQYIVSEIKNMDNYVREKLVDEGSSTQDAQDDTSIYNPAEILDSSIINNIIDGLYSHASGDVSYSDGHTFSIKIAKSLQNKVVLTLTILDNDFTATPTASKSMSYNLTTVIHGGNGDSESETVDDTKDSDDSSSTKSSTSSKGSTDNTVSKASKIPQTGRSYVANNVLVLSIIVTLLIIIGMIAYDVRKNKKN